MHLVKDDLVRMAEAVESRGKGQEGDDGKGDLIAPLRISSGLDRLDGVVQAFIVDQVLALCAALVGGGLLRRRR